MGWREEEGGLWSQHPDFQHEKRVGYSVWQWGHSLHTLSGTTQGYPESLMETEGQTAE